MTTRRWTVLAVCTANICRSPMMELLLRDRLDESRFEVASAGIKGWPDAPVDSMVRLELVRLGIDATAFRSRPLRSEHVALADVIVTATREHRSAVLEAAPGALRKTFTLLELAALVGSEGPVADIEHDGDLRTLVSAAARRRSAGPSDVDVPDPYRRPPETHRRVADLIDGATADLAQAFAGLGPHPD